jgi:hypothetical protein
MVKYLRQSLSDLTGQALRYHVRRYKFDVLTTPPRAIF